MKLLKKILSTALSFGIIFSSVLSLHVFAEGDQIPSTLEECCLELDKTCTPDVKDAIKLSSEDGLCTFHLGLGMWIRNHWIYPCEKGRISELLYRNGCSDADEESAIILKNYRHYLLTGESTVNVEDLVIGYWFDFWHRFNKNLKREEIQRKIEGLVQSRASRKTQSKRSWCTIL